MNRWMKKLGIVALALYMFQPAAAVRGAETVHLAAAKKAAAKKPLPPVITPADAEKAYDALKEKHGALLREVESLRQARQAAAKLSGKAATAAKKGITEKADLLYKHTDSAMAALEADADRIKAGVDTMTASVKDLKDKNQPTADVEARIALAQKKLSSMNTTLGWLKILPVIVEQASKAKAAEKAAAKTAK